MVRAGILLARYVRKGCNTHNAGPRLSNTSKPYGQSASLWTSIAELNTNTLDADTDADVCVVGAGIAGLTTAYLLAREGRSVIVLSDSAVGGGETGRTTAHLASVMDDRIYRLEQKHGEDNARRLVASHAAAISCIEEIVKRESIDCDFHRLDGYLFEPAGEETDTLEKEFSAALRAGLDVIWADRAPIADYETRRCLRFANQGSFHPLKYVNGLARAFQQMGGRIYTDTRVDEKFEAGSPVVVHTMEGRSVRCAHLVVATNSPALNFLEVHTKQVPYRTYALAFAVPRDSVEPALLWDTLDPYHYVRMYRDEEGTDFLIVGGEDHKTGQEDAAEKRWDALAEWTRVRYPMVTEIYRRWSGQVLEPIDGVAYIGSYDKKQQNIYCITGDSGQGMTHSTLGAMLIADLIAGRPNDWEDIYSPSRMTIGGLGEFVKHAGNTVRQFAEWLAPGEVDSPDKIPSGSGAVMRRGLHKVAVYRDPEGGVHEVSASCTHLGCIVQWNDAEHTWDCPCHGSRFNPVGDVINGPAVDNLRPAPSDD